VLASLMQVRCWTEPEISTATLQQPLLVGSTSVEATEAFKSAYSKLWDKPIDLSKEQLESLWWKTVEGLEGRATARTQPHRQRQAPPPITFGRFTDTQNACRRPPARAIHTTA